MAFPAVAEAQGSSRAQIRIDRQNGFTRPLEIPREPRWGWGRPCARGASRRWRRLPSRRQARRIKATRGEVRSPFDQGSKNRCREWLKIRAKTWWAGAFGARPSLARHDPDAGSGIGGLTPSEGRADNFSLDINSVTAAWPGCEWNPFESAADIRYLLQRTW